MSVSLALNLYIDVHRLLKSSLWKRLGKSAVFPGRYDQIGEMPHWLATTDSGSKGLNGSDAFTEPWKG